MPLYDFRCDKGHKFERFVKLTDFEEAQFCACSSSASRVISAPMFSVDQTDYRCPITDKHIGSIHAHRDNLDRHGCRVLETGETEGTKKSRLAREAAMDKAVDETVERHWDSLPSDSRERIGAELTNGVDLAVERR